MKCFSKKMMKNELSERNENQHSILSNESISEYEYNNDIVKDLTKHTRCKEENIALKAALKDSKEALDAEEISCNILVTGPHPPD